jgi:hypothetical protein
VLVENATHNNSIEQMIEIQCVSKLLLHEYHRFSFFAINFETYVRTTKEGLLRSQNFFRLNHI